MIGLISIVGACFIAFLGIKTLFHKKIKLSNTTNKPKSFWVGAMANFSSPYAYIFWFTVGAPFTKLLENSRKILIVGDYDVFHDGTVKIISTPGHTPGHESLQLTLLHAGTVILSGDLYHTRLSYLHQQMPIFNTRHKETLTSMTQINSILKKTNGRLIIQHDPQDYMSLPKIPHYLN